MLYLYFSCFGKKSTKRSRLKGRFEQMLRIGAIAPGNRLILIRCAEHHPLRIPRRLARGAEMQWLVLFGNSA